jgi:hypothetical protein
MYSAGSVLFSQPFRSSHISQIVVKYLYIPENASRPLLDDENVMERVTLQGQRLPLNVGSG